MNKPHSEVSDILTKRLCKTNVFFPLDLPCHKRVSHVQIFPISLWPLGTVGRVMMSWSGGGRGEKGWWRIWMFVRSLHHFLLSEALASFLIQWEQRLPDLSGGRMGNSSTPSHQLLWLIKQGLEKYCSFLFPSVTHLSFFSSHVLMQNNSWETETMITVVGDKNCLNEISCVP